MDNISKRIYDFDLPPKYRSGIRVEFDYINWIGNGGQYES